MPNLEKPINQEHPIFDAEIFRAELSLELINGASKIIDYSVSALQVNQVTARFSRLLANNVNFKANF